ncbi:hypothetical protein D3C78_1399320 [compost metagenome]
MASPAAPSAAMNEVVSTPTMDATLINSMIRSAMLARLAMKPVSARSTLRPSSTTPILRVRLLTSHQPTSRVSNARVSLPPYSRATGSQLSDSLTSSCTLISMGSMTRLLVWGSRLRSGDRHGQAAGLP